MKRKRMSNRASWAFNMRDYGVSAWIIQNILKTGNELKNSVMSPIKQGQKKLVLGPGLSALG